MNPDEVNQIIFIIPEDVEHQLLPPCEYVLHGRYYEKHPDVHNIVSQDDLNDKNRLTIDFVKGAPRFRLDGRILAFKEAPDKETYIDTGEVVPEGTPMNKPVNSTWSVNQESKVKHIYPLGKKISPFQRGVTTHRTWREQYAWVYITLAAENIFHYVPRAKYFTIVNGEEICNIVFNPNTGQSYLQDGERQIPITWKANLKKIRKAYLAQFFGANTNEFSSQGNLTTANDNEVVNLAPLNNYTDYNMNLSDQTLSQNNLQIQPPTDNLIENQTTFSQAFLIDKVINSSDGRQYKILNPNTIFDLQFLPPCQYVFYRGASEELYGKDVPEDIARYAIPRDYSKTTQFFLDNYKILIIPKNDHGPVLIDTGIPVTTAYTKLHGTTSYIVGQFDIPEAATWQRKIPNGTRGIVQQRRWRLEYALVYLTLEDRVLYLPRNRYFSADGTCNIAYDDSAKIHYLKDSGKDVQVTFLRDLLNIRREYAFRNPPPQINDNNVIDLSEQTGQVDRIQTLPEPDFLEVSNNNNMWVGSPSTFFYSNQSQLPVNADELVYNENIAPHNEMIAVAPHYNAVEDTNAPLKALNFYDNAHTINSHDTETTNHLEKREFSDDILWIDLDQSNHNNTKKFRT